MDAPRVLPDRPSLRYLKLEAKRRVAAGESRTLHEAHQAIAQEHGLHSWTALKRLVSGQQAECHPLTHMRWLISRFADAGRPRWTAPGEAELREHFTGQFFETTPPERLVAMAADHAADLRGRLVLSHGTSLTAVAEIAGIRVVATTEADPPHRLTDLHRFPLGSRIADARVAAPVTRTAGNVPGHVAGALDRAFTSLGVPGLVTGGRRGPVTASPPAAAGWTAMRGWADLETGEVLSPGYRFPVTGITTLVTAVAILRLVADGQVGLDDPVNRHLRSFRLGNDEVSVRELLTHTSGVKTPDRLFAASVPRLEELCGPVLACGKERGSFRFSFGGYAALGQVVADITGSRYEEAIRPLVLEPLGMHESSFPSTVSEAGGRVVTGYEVAHDGSFGPEARSVCTLPAAGGLWTTAADLVRFGIGWPSLLPPPLAREAVRPQASRSPYPGSAGLGWLITSNGDLAAGAGDSPGAVASLLVRLSDRAVQVTMANRRVPIESVNLSVLATEAGGQRR